VRLGETGVRVSIFTGGNKKKKRIVHGAEGQDRNTPGLPRRVATTVVVGGELSSACRGNGAG